MLDQLFAVMTFTFDLLAPAGRRSLSPRARFQPTTSYSCVWDGSGYILTCFLANNITVRRSREHCSNSRKLLWLHHKPSYLRFSEIVRLGQQQRLYMYHSSGLLKRLRAFLAFCLATTTVSKLGAETSTLKTWTRNCSKEREHFKMKQTFCVWQDICFGDTTSI